MRMRMLPGSPSSVSLYLVISRSGWFRFARCECILVVPVERELTFNIESNGVSFFSPHRIEDLGRERPAGAGESSLLLLVRQTVQRPWPVPRAAKRYNNNNINSSLSLSLSFFLSVVVLFFYYTRDLEGIFRLSFVSRTKTETFSIFIFPMFFSVSCPAGGQPCYVFKVRMVRDTSIGKRRTGQSAPVSPTSWTFPLQFRAVRHST